MEDPNTGKLIEGPLVVGDALLHTPHLGEATALYHINQVGEKPMQDETTVAVPVSFFDRLLGRVQDEPEKEPEPELTPVVEAEKYEAVTAERDELTAKVQTMEAEQRKAERIAHFVAELKEHEAVKEDAEIHELLAGLDEETSEALVTKFKALAAQIKESNLTELIGASGDPDNSNPDDLLNAAVEEKMKETGTDYPTAFGMVRTEQPELFTVYKGGK